MSIYWPVYTQSLQWSLTCCYPALVTMIKATDILIWLLSICTNRDTWLMSLTKWILHCKQVILVGSTCHLGYLCLSITFVLPDWFPPSLSILFSLQFLIQCIRLLPFKNNCKYSFFFRPEVPLSALHDFCGSDIPLKFLHLFQTGSTPTISTASLCSCDACFFSPHTQFSWFSVEISVTSALSSTNAESCSLRTSYIFSMLYLF